MKLTILLMCTLYFAPFVNMKTYAGWEIYDDFNDDSLDASKWDVRTFRGGNITEISGHLILSAALHSEPRTGGSSSHASGANLSSRLEAEDVIKGLRMTYLISNYCDGSYDLEYIGGTIFRPGGYIPVPVGYDYANLLMSTRSLTQDSIPTNEQLITNTRFTFSNATAVIDQEENSLKTQIWSRFNDGHHNVTNQELEVTTPFSNKKHTGTWSQLTTQFIDPSIITTTASWTQRKTHYEDTSMRLIEKNDPADGPGWFGTANGQFTVWFNAAPKLSGAIKSCKVWIDKIEVYR